MRAVRALYFLRRSEIVGSPQDADGTAAICDEMNVEIPVREIFEHPVLADQALALAGYQAKSVDETELAQMLHNLDELSDEDVERLLAAESEAE